MAARRIGYLAALLTAMACFWLHREWLSWMVLLAVVFLPWLSFLVSLPAMLLFRVGVDCPGQVQRGASVRVHLNGHCRLPVPPFRGKLHWSSCLWGHTQRLGRKAALPTDHCGGLVLTPKRVWVYDYLGLIGLPALRKETALLLVQPNPEAPRYLPEPERCLSSAWRPKVGGGFSENHELRLYRPGDHLKGIHWKLSAKTGKLIFREPMEAVRGAALLTMTLYGAPDQLDRKLGRLLWVSRYLLGRNITHHLQCLTGHGMEEFSIQREEDLQQTLRRLLTTPCASTPEGQFQSASWRFHIGGDEHEV